MPPNDSPAASVGQKSRGVLAALLTAVSLLILAGFLWPGSVGWAAQAMLVCAVPVLLILLSGAASQCRLLLAAMISLWVLLSGSWVVLIWLDGAGVRTLVGIPLVLWVLIFGLSLVPLALVSWVYAATFRTAGVGLEKPRRSARIGNRPESGET